MLTGSNMWDVSQNTLLSTVFTNMQILCFVWLYNVRNSPGDLDTLPGLGMTIMLSSLIKYYIVLVNHISS